MYARVEIARCSSILKTASREKRILPLQEEQNKQQIKQEIHGIHVPHNGMLQ